MRQERDRTLVLVSMVVLASLAIFQNCWRSTYLLASIFTPD